MDWRSVVEGDHGPDVFPVMVFAPSVHTSTQLSHKMPLTVKNSSINLKISAPLVLVGNGLQRSRSS